MDTAAYVSFALSSPPAKAYFVSPLYLYFLRAFGVSLLVARVAQIVLGSAAVVLIFDMTRRWFGDRAANIAASLAILTGVISFYEITILPAALDPFLIALTLSLLTYALQTRDTIVVACTGIALGLFVLNRPNALLCVPAVVIALAWIRGWRAALMALTAFVVALAPFTIRNYVVAHQFVPIASHGGLNFYIGNNRDADGTYHHVEGIRPTIVGQDEDAPRVEAQFGSFYARAFDWMRANPLRAGALFLRKLAYTFNRIELTLNYSYSYFVNDARSPLPLLVAGPLILFPLGIVGAVLNLRNRAFAAWWAFVPLYAISVALFFVSSRYRMPLLIPMCVTSAAMFIRPRWPAWAAAVVLAIGVSWNFGLDDGRAHERTNMIVYLIEQYRFDDADKLIASTDAMTRDRKTLHDRSAEAYRAVAVASVRSNQADTALRGFEAAHALDPADASDLLNIAVLQAQHGDIDAARENARAALRLRPGYSQAEGLLQALKTP